MVTMKTACGMKARRGGLFIGEIIDHRSIFGAAVAPNPVRKAAPC